MSRLAKIRLEKRLFGGTEKWGWIRVSPNQVYGSLFFNTRLGMIRDCVEQNIKEFNVTALSVTADDEETMNTFIYEWAKAMAPKEELTDG